mmetsp:Transcript_40561/g.73308  ORF Transcript_40561/g.73308 Transcript_40561/m.73308 type:complete len:192 (-) Transcript_40561:24-599(-)
MLALAAAAATGAVFGAIAGATAAASCGGSKGRKAKFLKQVKVEGQGHVAVHTKVKHKNVHVTLDSEALLGVPDLPFCSAVVSPDGTIYVSGVVAAQKGTDGKPAIVPGGPEDEVIKILEIIDATLRACGATKDNVTMVHAFLVNYTDDNFALMNRGYLKYWNHTTPPARICTGTDRVGLGGNVELDVVAHL